MIDTHELPGTVAGPRLLADIGGTRVRLAWQAAGEAPLQFVQVLDCDHHASLQDCLHHYLGAVRQAGLAAPVQAALGIATPVTADTVRMTNRAWEFSITALREAMGWQRLVVLNDFTALALAIPALPASDLQTWGGGAAQADAPRALIGPGTGLGVSGLVPCRDGHSWTALQTEGGHVALAPQTEREEALLGVMRRRFGRVSAERALSGPGLVNLVEALCALDGQTAPPGLTPAEVLDGALRGQSPACAEALSLFWSFLGDVAGDLALSLGARGGVYVGGGIVPRVEPGVLRQTPFRARFEAKGRLSHFLRDIPVFVLRPHTVPALLGASEALRG